MVHRPPDSRLLNNLIENEKEYAKHLAALFPISHTALASLSAYAAASSPSHPASPAIAITTVVDALASADDALQRYTHAIDAWRQQLVDLKVLEDDLAAVLRDRDIFVTRLIKASKSTRDAHRSSRLVAPLAALGSASLSSLPSTNSTAGSSPASTNAKLAQAQAELQACEAHLVAKERELDARRISIARDSLGARCRALVHCACAWGEMGKKGLEALQALGADDSGAVPKQSLAVPPRLSTNPTTYASDSSSLTPSQSASQTAARSVETSHEGPAAKERERVQPAAQPETTSRPHAQSSRTNDDADLTITLPPAHAIPELAFPTSTVRTPSRPLQNGDDDPSTHPNTPPELALRRKRNKGPRRPLSQHIPEASDVPTANPRVAFPTTTHDTSSDDDAPTALQVVENDPFEVIRRSLLGPVGGAAPPAARASAPDVRASIVVEHTPSKAFPGSSLSASGLGQARGQVGQSPPARRPRKTSMAFFGSLRGLFRKPKERERVVEWDGGRISPSPEPSPQSGRRGWVTRTDARIRARGREDSDEEVERRTARAGTNVARAPSGARLRKGRPGASSPPHRATIDGWITDAPADAGMKKSSAAVGRSRTRRGRKKLSVADLRGSEQGHTDGELDGRRSVERASKPVVEQEKRVAADARPVADPNLASDANVNAPSPQRRATTTVATRGRPSDAPPAHRRSASLSVVDTHLTIVSTSGSGSTAASTGGTSWRKPPPAIDVQPSCTPPRTPSPAPSPRTHESPKQAARRNLGNGNGHPKHAQNQSLMSIVADVTRQQERVVRSLDLPRAPGSVLREASAERVRSSEDVQGQGREIKASMPLRSALRTSRTPSPVTKDGAEEEEGRGRGRVAWRDSASVSSYETVRESLDGSPSPVVPSCRASTATVRSRSQPPRPVSFTIPPPPVEPPPVRAGAPNGNGDGDGDAKETPPVRRKSVRVSLQPTFSPAPPALDDEDQDQGRYSPWEGKGKKTGGGDVWADSSEEDETYARARRLLSLVGRGGRG